MPICEYVQAVKVACGTVNGLKANDALKAANNKMANKTNAKESERLPKWERLNSRQLMAQGRRDNRDDLMGP